MHSYIRPKPQPKRKRITLKGKAYTEFRRKVAKRAKEHCEKCGLHAPRLWYGVFNLWWCGNVAHIKSRGAGGDDTMGENGSDNNVRWLCFECHRKEHDGRGK